MESSEYEIFKYAFLSHISESEVALYWGREFMLILITECC